ncbi:MAG: AI-2E family transporter [Ktedonobacterales bacterium]
MSEPRGELSAAAGSSVTLNSGDGDDEIKEDDVWSRRRDRILTVLLWGVAVGVVLWLLAHVVQVVLLLAISTIIAFALEPLTVLLGRVVPRFLAIFAVYVLALAALGALGYLVVSASIAELSSLVLQIQHFVSNGPNGAPSPLVRRLTELGISKQQIDSFTLQIAGQAQSALPFVGQLVNSLITVLLDTVLILVLSVYLLVNGERSAKWVLANAPISYRPRVALLINTVQRVIGGYIRGQLFLSTLIGTLVGLGMLVLQVPYAILLGLLAFVLEFIPTVGTLTSGAVCILVAATQSWVLAIIVLGYFVIIHVLDGYIIAPRVLGRAIGLHPAVSIVALVAGAELFGIWGAIFAAPLAGLIQVLLSAAWAEWRGLHPRQFPEVLGATVVPVTNAEALPTTSGTEPRAFTGGRRMSSSGPSGT